jgi:TRAP-type C4-dicarboxylate transport system permease small subunit
MLIRLKRAIDRILAVSVSILMTVLLFAVVWQVFSRYVLKDPSSYTDELSRFLLIWVALLGASYATGQKLHLAIDLLQSRIKSVWLDRLIYALIGLFALLALVIGGIRLVNITLSLEQTSAALQIPLGYVYLVLPLSGIMIILYALIEMLNPQEKSS